MQPVDLASLRQEIDRIDDGIVDLLAARSAVVRQVAAIKGDKANGRTAIRPAREAQILRRLVASADGRFPAAVLVQLWREMICSFTRAQAPLNVVVVVPSGQPGIWDLARDHFGALTPAQRSDEPLGALRAVADGRVQIAVLPLPAGNAWWRSLVPTAGAALALQVIARLPFGARRQGDEALAVAHLTPEPSGDDRSLLVIEAEAGLSRGTLHDRLTAAGRSPRLLDAVIDGSGGLSCHLVEVAGFVEPGPSPLAGDLGPLGERIRRVVPIGAYARPLELDSAGYAALDRPLRP